MNENVRSRGKIVEGDIFLVYRVLVCLAGWLPFSIDYYIVVKRSSKFVFVKKLKKELVPKSDNMYVPTIEGFKNYVMACPKSEPFRRKLHDEFMFKLDSRLNAYLWDGEPRFLKLDEIPKDIENRHKFPKITKTAKTS